MDNKLRYLNIFTAGICAGCWIMFLLGGGIDLVNNSSRDYVIYSHILCCLATIPYLFVKQTDSE